MADSTRRVDRSNQRADSHWLYLLKLIAASLRLVANINRERNVRRDLHAKLSQLAGQQFSLLMAHAQTSYNIIDKKNFAGHDDEVNCVAFSSDFEILVTGSDDTVVRVFNTVSGSLVIQLDGHTGSIRAVAVCPNSQYFASASFDTTVRIWQTRTAVCLHLLEEHTRSVECLAFSSDGYLVCSGSWDKSAILWNVVTGDRLKLLQCHTNLVQSVAFSWKQHWLATGSWDYTVHLWQVAGHRERKDHTHDKQSSEDHTEADDKPVILHGHTGNVHSVAFSREGMLASGSWDKTIRLWNPRTSICLHILVGHHSWVQAVAFSTDSLTLVSAAEDETVRVWDCVSGASLGVIEGETESVSNCAFGPGSAVLVSGAANVTLALC